MDIPMSPSIGREPTCVSIYGEHGGKFVGHKVNDIVTFKVTGRVTSVSEEGATVEISSLEKEDYPRTVQEAGEKAEVELLVRARTEPYPG